MPEQVQSCVLVIFGASGDLTRRKLIPALYEMSGTGELPPNVAILGTARTDLTSEQWRDDLEPWVKDHAQGFDAQRWRDFAQRLTYVTGDAMKPEVYQTLKQQISTLSAAHGCGERVLFYLSVAPFLYQPIVEQIDKADMVRRERRWYMEDRDQGPWQRIIVEKPFGHDLESAEELNRAIGRVFEEDSIYRIDHYLGKELVQNLLVMRFANTIFEPIWNHRYIDHVQITAAESVSVGTRAEFYDKAGAIRDMLQSHLLQVMALVAMEPPTSFTDHYIRKEKVQIIDAIEPLCGDELATSVALGQYGGDDDEPAYHLRDDVPDDSTTETFAAIKLHFDNWRWGDTPFYLRTGKRMAKKLTEVVVQFKPPAANLFRNLGPMRDASTEPANQIIIQIAPDEGVSMRFKGKVPGGELMLGTVAMDFDYEEHFKAELVEAYGPLILDAMTGDRTLFKHRYEVEGAWRAVMPFLGEETEPLRRDIHANYEPGSWGPKCADDLIQRDGRMWRNV